MIWRGAVMMVLVLMTLVVGGAFAAAPEGPRLALVKLGSRPGRLELLSVDPTGALPLRIAGGGSRARPLPYPFTSPAWSPDGSELAFTGIVGAESRLRRIFVVTADGEDVRLVPGTEGAYDPVFSPDGHTLAFARIRERSKPNGNGGEDVVYRSASVWLADLDGRKPRRIHSLAQPASPGAVLLLARRIGAGDHSSGW